MAKPQRGQKRPDPFYLSPYWKRLRAVVLARDPYCRTPGCTRRSTHADHIVPRSQGGRDILANLRGLCASCHNRRTAMGNAEPGLPGCGPDGMPLDRSHYWYSGR